MGMFLWVSFIIVYLPWRLQWRHFSAVSGSKIVGLCLSGGVKQDVLMIIDVVFCICFLEYIDHLSNLIPFLSCWNHSKTTSCSVGYFFFPSFLSHLCGGSQGGQGLKMKKENISGSVFPSPHFKLQNSETFPTLGLDVVCQSVNIWIQVQYGDLTSLSHTWTYSILQP